MIYRHETKITNLEKYITENLVNKKNNEYDNNNNNLELNRLLNNFEEKNNLINDLINSNKRLENQIEENNMEIEKLKILVNNLANKEK